MSVRINWECEPNWISNFRISYAFKTSIYTAESGREQRAALQNRPIRTIQFSIMEGSDLATRLCHQLMNSLDKEVIVPIFSQRFKLTDECDLQGLYVIHSESIPELFDVQIASGLKGTILIKSIDGSMTPKSSESLYVQTVSGNEIAFETGFGVLGIISSINGTKAECYPTVVSYLESYSEIFNTDNLMSIDFTFKEKDIINGINKEDIYV